MITFIKRSYIRNGHRDMLTLNSENEPLWNIFIQNKDRNIQMVKKKSISEISTENTNTAKKNDYIAVSRIRHMLGVMGGLRSQKTYWPSPNFCVFLSLEPLVSHCLYCIFLKFYYICMFRVKSDPFRWTCIHLLLVVSWSPVWERDIHSAL